MATERSTFETTIIGETVRLSADISEDRLRRISEYINEKAKEIQRVKRGLSTATPLFRLLVNVNLADDVLTAREQTAKLKSKVSALEKDLAKAKQEIKEYEELFEKQG